MGKSRPTEEDLGIAQTAEEKAILDAPPPDAPIDDYPEGGDPDPVFPDPTVPAEPEPDAPPKLADKEPAKTEQPKPDKPPPGFVDQRALQEARAEKRLLEERMNVLLEVVNRTTKPAEPKPEAPTKPVLEQNPMGYIGHIDERLARLEGMTAEQQSAWDAQVAEQQAVEAAMQVALPQFNEAAAADPTVQPTHAALRIALGREYAWQQRIPFETATPAQQQRILDYVNRIEEAHVRYAVENGINVVEHMKGFAASRGIAPVSPQQPAPEPKTIEQRRQQQQRHQSLSDAPGSEVPAKLSAKDIARMTPKQFAALAAKIGDTGLDELMGPGGNA